MKTFHVVLCHFLYFLENKYSKIYHSAFLLKIGLLLIISLGCHVHLYAQVPESDYEIIDVEDLLKKVCWPQKNTAKTDATSNKMETDTAGFPSAMSGGLAPSRRLLNAVLIPNSFPTPDTAEIFDLLGNPLIINGTLIKFDTSEVAAIRAQNQLGGNSTGPNGFHWVGYKSNPFQPDNIAVYYYNIFHRWYTGMPCHYESYPGKQWNGDNSGLDHPSDTVFQPHLILASILQPISCYGANNGIIKVNTPALNYYTFSLNSSPPTLNNTFSSLAAGIYTITFTDSFANSCDTIITLSQPNSLGSSDTVNNCGVYSWPKNSLNYTSSGVYFFNSVVAGCPKQDTLMLTVTPSVTSTTSVTAYNSYTWPVNGQTYTSSGSYFNNATTSPGCQTFSSLNLNIIYSPFNVNLIIDQPISCNGAVDGSIQAIATPTTFNYIYSLDGGIQVNNTGFFQGLAPGVHTVCVSNGTTGTPVCKTILLTQPKPLNVTIVTDSLVSCQGNDGKLSAIITGGTHIVQPYLTFWKNSANILLNPVPNNFDTFITGLTPGMYHLQVEDDNGCLANANKLLNAAQPLSVTASYPSINCHGGNTSIVPASTGGIAPISYTIIGSAVGSVQYAGNYSVMATDAKGCFANTLVNVVQPPPINSSMTATACNSYYWSTNATTYTASGFYMAFLSTVSGCMIMCTLDLTINTNTSSSSSITACNSYLWPQNGLTYTASGTYTSTSLNPSGCLHTSTLFLTINQNTTNSKTAVACNSYNWSAVGANNPYTISGTYTATSINSQGCLHTETLFLTVNYSTTGSQTVTACNSYTWNIPGSTSSTYTVSGNYIKTTLNAAGCIRTDTLHLTINYSTTGSQTVTACNSYTWNIPGSSSITYTVSGNYTKTSLNAAGCIRTDTLHLTINYNTTSTQTVSACNSYSWNAGTSTGITYTVSGIYSATSINSSGCLHTAVLNLTIRNSTSSVTNITATNTYTWIANGNTYTNSGTYAATLLNSVGCDSLLTLNLVINQTSAILNLKCFIEGYMQTANFMKPVLFNQGQPTSTGVCDTIRVELHSSSPPYGMVHFVKTLLHRNGTAVCNFPSANGNFYIVVKHRNGLQTWSALPVTIGTNTVNYDFSLFATKAYGANQTQIASGVWAFFSGDVDNEENIDLLDLNELENDVSNFNFGYLKTDIDGDGSVDLLDLPLVEQNIGNFIFTKKPN